MLEFSTDAFSYNKEDKIFVSESSDLDLSAREWNSGRRIPAEIAVKLINYNTGNSMVFTWFHSDMDCENEVHGWNYKSEEGINLLIIND